MEWIETASGNRISKHAEIHGSDHILIAGNTTVSGHVQLHGDVKLMEGKTAIQIGRFCYIGENVHVTPPFVGSRLSTSKNVEVKVHKTCKLGSYTMIGDNSVIKSSNVGSRVIVGDGCTLQDSSVIHDCVIIKSNTYIPEHFNIPPFSLVESITRDIKDIHTKQEQQEQTTTPETTEPNETIIDTKKPTPVNRRLKITPLPESYKKLIEFASKQSYINNQFTPSEIP